MSQDKNLFGGGNVNSLYVPMSDLEQEVLYRLREREDLEVRVVGWGVVHKPRVAFGDHRIQVQFRLDFTAPAVPQPLFDLELELRTRAGKLLFRDKKSTVYDGKPIQVAAGMFLDMVWDIALHSMDPALVKAVLPRATGLTTRRGNMRLTPTQQAVLAGMERAHQVQKAQDRKKLQDALDMKNGKKPA